MKNKKHILSRRSFFGNTAALAVGFAITGPKVWGAPAYIPNLLKLNSKINGVQLGVITYSFRELEDQSAEATLQYVLDCGVNAIELMGGTAESFIGRPENKMDRRKYYSLLRKEKNKDLKRDGRKELADLKLQKESYEKELEQWRKNRSLDGFIKLREMYNAAGVEIYAFKPNYLLTSKNSDANINYAMQAGKLLGASHVTIELPRKSEHSLKLGKMGQKNGIKVAYHGHEKQHSKWWDVALKQSTYNAMNLDIGHYIAAGNKDVLELLKNKNQHILSMHVKDRQNLTNGKSNMPFGMGDTPIKEVLKLMRDQKYQFLATVEYEYKTPEASSVIQEIKKSIEYCKNALES